MDEAPIAFTMNPSSIGKGQIAEIALSGLWGMSLGNNKIRISSKAGEVERYVKIVLPASAVLDLEFDEGSGTDAFDSSGNNNNGILYNDSIHSKFGGGPAIKCSNPPTVGCPKWVEGKHGKALKFDADYDYVEVLDSTSLDSLAYTKQATWSLWFKFESFVFPEVQPTFLGKNFTEQFKEYDIRFNYNGTSQNFKKISLALANGTDIDYLNIDKTDWNIGEWYHLTINYNNTTRISNAYVNGIFINSHTFTLNNLLIDVSEPLLIGISFEAMAFNGTIDNIRIYNKALTPDETVVLKLGEFE
jgi:hypothetical protein